MTTLKKITGTRLRVIFPEYWRGQWKRPGPLQRIRPRTRVFDVYLDCGHAVTVPFGRRPKVGKRMRCPVCGLK